MDRAEKIFTLTFIVTGVVAITTALPELIYYAPPVIVVMYTLGILLAGAGIRSLLKG